MTMHVIPDDEKGHDESEDCKCKPLVEYVLGNTMIYHNAWESVRAVNYVIDILNNKKVNMKQLKAHDFPEVYKWLGLNLNTLGCVMLDVVPLPNMYSIELEGAAIALYYAKNKERFWIDGWIADKVAHVTLLYGLLEQGKNYEPHIKKVLEGWQLKEVEIDKVGYFDSPYPDEPYYCIIAHIKVTPELLEGHQRLEFLPHVNTFAEYKPHMTICYIDKQQGVEYKDRLIEEFNSLWAGKKLEVKEEINLGGNK